MLAENDVPPKYLQTRMGHANLQVTMKVYLYITEKMAERGDEILQKMIYRARAKRTNKRICSLEQEKRRP